MIYWRPVLTNNGMIELYFTPASLPLPSQTQILAKFFSCYINLIGKPELLI